MLRRWLEGMARFARRRYYTVFLGAALLLACAGLAITRLRFDTDVLNLIPKKDPVVTTYLDTLAEFGTFDYLMILVEVPEGAPADPYESYADALAAHLEKLPELASVEHRIEDPEKLLEQMIPRALLLLDGPGREQLAARLSPEGIKIRVEELRRRLATPQSLVLSELSRRDPLGLAEVLIDRVQSSQGGIQVDWMSGYFLSPDQRLLLLLAKPTRPPQDIGFDQRVVKGIRQAIAQTNDEFVRSIAPEEKPPRVRLGGSHLNAMEDAGLIQGDMIVNILSSMGMVLALFWYAFRRPSSLSYAFLPLSAGLVLSFGFAAVVFGTVSSATSGTAALLTGLGIDFAVVIYGRFVEERRLGASFDAALATAMGSAGPAVVAGAFTTVATFYAFTFTDFKGLRQMGLLTGTGILFCLAGVLVLLPALLAWSEDRHLRRESEARIYMHSFGADRLARWSYRHPWAVLVPALVGTLVMAFLATRLTFQDSWKSMRAAGGEGPEVEREVAEHFKSDFDFMMLILRGREVEPLLDRTEEVTAQAQGLVTNGTFTSVNSATVFLPSPRRQKETQLWLAERRARGELDAARTRAELEAALTAEGLRVDAFAQGLDLLEQALSPPEHLSFDSLPVDGQAARFLERVLHRYKDGWQSVIYLYPRAGEWSREAPPDAQKLAASLGPDVVLTGANVINKYMRERVRRDSWIALALGTLIVMGILVFDFRRVGPALASLVPLAVGMVWMLGSMTGLGISMNFMNIFVTTMIIGIGSDYGIHMVHRYRETGSLDLSAGLGETASAIMLAALTTVVGFGSLVTSHFPGMRSTGYVAALGTFGTVMAAVTVLPALMGLWRRAPGRKEAP
ncbi:MAG: MMPL family transporter [Thermoanaerobaculia bacterium]